MTRALWPASREALEHAGLGLLVLLPALRTWLGLDRRSSVAHRARQLLLRAGGDAALAVVLAASVFVVAAEDVLDGAPHELLVQTDRVVRPAARDLGALPTVHRLAAAVSGVTGIGLAGAVAGGGLGLAVARRRREAVALVAGSLGAWLLSAGVKLAFAVPRPGTPHTAHPISGYGFPSAHVLVTVAACGLLVWALGREAAAGERWRLYAGAGLLAGVTAASRVVLDAHWVSDVLGGLALGVVWLQIVLLAAAPSGPSAGTPA